MNCQIASFSINSHELHFRITEALIFVQYLYLPIASTLKLTRYFQINGGLEL